MQMPHIKNFIHIYEHAHLAHLYLIYLYNIYPWDIDIGIRYNSFFFLHILYSSIEELKLSFIINVCMYSQKKNWRNETHYYKYKIMMVHSNTHTNMNEHDQSNIYTYSHIYILLTIY